MLESEDASDWYELKLKACADEENGVLLCPELFSFKSYTKKKWLTSSDIFEANCQQAWDGLTQGKHTELDIMFLKHEFVELIKGGFMATITPRRMK